MKEARQTSYFCWNQGRWNTERNSILSISETAGLGMKATTEHFKISLKINRMKIPFQRQEQSGDDMIDAISGATITTNAVTNGVNAALYIFGNVEGGGSHESKNVLNVYKRYYQRKSYLRADVRYVSYTGSYNICNQWYRNGTYHNSGS